MPRRSGTTAVWSFASSAAIGDHMSPVLPKPWISTTAGPWPSTRTLIVASAFTTCELRKSARKGVGAACADRALSARLAARPAATRRNRRENVDETVADMLGSLGWGTHAPIGNAKPTPGVTKPAFHISRVVKTAFCHLLDSLLRSRSPVRGEAPILLRSTFEVW